jgi:hypothetical protein
MQVCEGIRELLQLPPERVSSEEYVVEFGFSQQRLAVP